MKGQSILPKDFGKIGSFGLEPKSKKRVSKKILRRMVWQRDKGKCQLCGVKIRVGEDWDLARKKAGSRGGEYTYSNCFVAHHSCNTSQGTQSLKQTRRSLGVSKRKKKSTKKHRKRKPITFLNFK